MTFTKFTFQQKHSFLAIHPSQTSYSDDESVSIKEICDKFPMTEENEIGLRQLYESGPSDSFYLIKFWADSDFTPNDNLLQKYEIASIFESAKSRQIEITTIVYSFSKQAVKKIQNASPHIGSQNRAVYRMNSDLCDYGKGFIEKLLLLSPDKTKMDLVLENFNVLYKVTDEKTQETLLVLALVFEVSKNSQGSTYNIYKFRS
jgi:transcriptional enhancer factor